MNKFIKIEEFSTEENKYDLFVIYIFKYDVMKCYAQVKFMQ